MKKETSIKLKPLNNTYTTYQDSAKILSKLFGLDIVKVNEDLIKASFKSTELDKITKKLDEEKINYIIYEEEIIKKDFGEENTFKKNI